jgi:hypothetical protein
MNGQLPPIDHDLRDQLARRSSGQVPEGLIQEIHGALDAIPVERPRRLNLSAPWRAPRLAAAGGIAFVAVLAIALVAVPVLRRGPAGPSAGLIAGYPADRPLTATELDALMAGPNLPVNTTLVAAVTIVTHNDVCPMNRYPTIGVVEGMSSQVCVMAGSLSQVYTSVTVQGTFAFRYIAPGYLGLLAEVTPASSRLAFHVVEDWPLYGKAFLVEGYLGATQQACASETASTGDVLEPSGYEQCAWSWLSDDGSPAAVQSFATWSAPSEISPTRSIDLLALDGKARHVEAGGARQIDSLPNETTFGVYVVRPFTGPCPGDAPFSSIGCVTWRVLAKVPAMSLPGPNASPSPSEPTSQVAPNGLLGANNEAFTLGELLDAMNADPDHLAGKTIVIDAPFGSGVVCPSDPVVSSCGALKDLLRSKGTWAVRIGVDGLFVILGEVQKGDGTLVSTLALALAADPGSNWVVDAWLSVGARSYPAGVPTDRPLADLGQIAVLTSDGTASEPYQISVQNGAYSKFVGTPTTADGPPVHGLFLLSIEQETRGELLARFAPEGSTPEPTASPATPQPSSVEFPFPMSGLAGSGGRPLTPGEFLAAFAADPNRLAGRVVIVKGPVTATIMCVQANALGPCLAMGSTELIAQEGYWAVQVGADGKLTLLGELTLTKDGGFVFWPEDVIADTSLQPNDLLIVSAELSVRMEDYCDAPGVSCIPPADLRDTSAVLDAGPGAYRAVTGHDTGNPISGLYLIRRGTDTVTILAGFELTELN